MVSVKRVVSHSIVTAQVPGESDQPITTGLWAPRRTHSTPPRAPAPRPPPHARDDYLCVKRYELVVLVESESQSVCRHPATG
eukprot:scaffold70286_cov69-Phaeocystis_antarctica.AAC.1